MGQNGAGKSTIFSLIIGALKPESGRVIVGQGVTIATAKQVIPRKDLDLTVREFFAACFPKKIYDIDPRIDDVLEVVNLKNHEKVHERIVKSFSGGQQARLLLASALIQSPDLLLLDEPTNNLDTAGIAHLTEFLKNYKKTVIVISHDAEFLNAFSTGVLYLDIFTRKVEQYVGNYFDVSSQIIARVEKENRKNAQLAKEIQEKFVEDLIPVVDSFSMAMANKEAWEKVDATWRMGVEYIYNQLMSALETHGLKLYGEVGDKFDPTSYEAINEEATGDKDKDHTVAKVVQKGFMLGDSVLRPARVSVYTLSK
jgi:ATPase subunit of ABC transporter with duplicated ATPase domains